MTNAVFARSLVSLEEYDLMFKTYEKRALSGPNRLWFKTIARQRSLKKAES